MINGLEPLQKTIEHTMIYNKERVTVTCHICKSNNWELLDVIRQPITDSHLCICKGCGFVTYNPQLKNLNKYYELEVRPQSIDFMNTKRVKLEKHKKIVFDFLKKQKIKPQSILDYGCSDGYLLKEFEERGLGSEKIKGVELNPGHANWAKFISGLDVTTNQDLSGYSADTFDFISCYHVLEHVQEPDKLLAEFSRITRTDGLLYIGLPVLDRIDYSTRSQLFKEDHINLFTRDTLTQLVAQFNFIPIHTNTYLYGTAIIFKKVLGKVKPIKSYYDDTIALLKKIHACLSVKEQLDKVMGSGNIDQARNVCVQALKEFDEYPELIIKYASLNDAIDEQDILKEWIEKKPDMYELHVSLALSLLKDGSFKEAEEHFLKAMESTGKLTVCLFNIAQAKYQQGDYIKAVEYLNQALELEPYNLSSFEMLATILSKL